MNGNAIHSDSDRKEITVTLGRREAILATLRRFKEDGTGTFEEKKYQCAWKLTNPQERDSQKRDLETVKADIEFQIENDRTLAALLAFIGVVISNWVSARIREDFKQGIAALVGVLFAALGICFLYKIHEKASWLHILKIALTRKSNT